MNEQPKVGKLLYSKARRDAIHVAVLPVIAAHTLRPGEHVGISYEFDGLHFVGDVDDKIGIVDPFLTDTVPTNGKFYLLLYPNTITSMRHHWEHPALSGKK